MGYCVALIPSRSQSVLFRVLCLALLLASAPSHATADYTGSAACRDCHSEEFKAWQATANP